MKKLFSFLCLLVLGAGMSVLAQVVLVPKDRPMSLLERIDVQQQEVAILTEMATENIAQHDYQMAGRNNAPAATMASLSFSWSNVSSVTKKVEGTYNAVYNYNWTGSYPYLRLYMIFPKASAVTWNGKTCPAYGDYTIRNSADPYTMMNSAVTDNDGSRYYRSGVDINSSKYYRFTSGSTVTVREGVDGPYIVIHSTSNKNSSNNTVTSGDYVTIDVTVGSPAPASGEDGTIQVVPGANGEIKVGSGSWQSTTFSQGYTGGTYVTISAQGTGDYVFDQWLEDGNTDATRTITVDGNATYTATFKKLIIHHTFYWANLAEGGTDAEYGSGDGLYVYRLYFTDGGINYPSLDLQLLYDKSKLKDYGSITAPPEGVYNMLNSVYDDFVEFYALGGTENSSYMSRYWDANNSYKPFRTGTITISQGANGYPYIEVITGQGNGTKQFFEITVGEPAAAVVTHNVSITAPTNGTITVSYNDGSAQSFTSGSRDIAENTVLTVTTTPVADYHFGAWTGNGAASVTVNGDKTIGATFAQNDYFLNATYGAGGASVTRSDNGNNLTVKRAGNTVTLTPTAATGYNFLAWAGDDAAKMSGNVFTFPTNGTHNTTYNVQATFQAITYDLTYNGLEGATHSNPATYTVETATITLTDPSVREGYTFTGWTCGGSPITQIAVGSTGDKTITANWTQNGYTVTLAKNNDAYGTLTDSKDNVIAEITGVEDNAGISISGNRLTIGSTTVTATAADKSADGIIDYEFVNWTDGDGKALPTMVTADMTIRANFTRFTTLCENCDNGHYNAFREYDKQTLTAKLFRKFESGRWSTLCLPFDVNKAMFSSLNFGSRIYEFRYAEGNADTGVNLYFSIAKSIKAGQGYIVNANAALAARTSFTFPGVNIDLSKDNGAELNSVTAYDNLTGSGATQGNIELVGTLRKGTLKGTTDGNTYMGLKENKIYYPNIATGSTILAYRGIFRSIKGTLNAERIRIIVDGEEKAELEVINGELQDVQDTKKFIENGVLYIERNGIIYDATGRKVE